jgi:hypothetical protein
MIISSAVASVSSAQFSAAGTEARVGARPSNVSASNNAQLESARELQDLADTDRRVRAHEAAHLAASGGLAQGGASFSTVRGPDGRMYAVGGEVSIDVSRGRTPEETIARAQTVRRAALAPADPSSQDYRVAAQAAQMQAEAQRELARQSVQGVAADGATPALSRSLASYNTTTQSEPQVNLFA